MDIIENIENLNIGKLWDYYAETYNNKTALITISKNNEEVSYSYRILNNLINKTANIFLSLGIKKGDMVAVKLCNTVEFLLSWFGANKIGAIIVPMHTSYTCNEINYILNTCNPALFIAPYEDLELINNMQNNGEIDKNITLLSSNKIKENNNINCFHSLLHSASDKLILNYEINNQDIAEILFTSGTTSKPKGVLITHYNLIYAGYFTQWQGQINSNDIYLTTMPSFHVDFQCTAALPTFYAGATFIMVEKYSASRFWKQVCSHKATITECIPFTIRTLLKQKQEPWEKNHHVREIFYYLTMCKEEKEEFTNRYNVNLLSSYGMTETIIGLIGDIPNTKRKWPSIGQVCLDYQVKIVDEKGYEVLPNKSGELLIKGIIGKTIFKGYYNNEEATKKAFIKDGYFKTGDIVYVDEEGYYFFLDRNVNMIKRAGENISCTEIENVIESHPSVDEVSVVGVKNGIHDEIVKARVVLHPNTTLTLEELQDYCCNRLAEFKIPTMLEIKDFFEKTPTGKIKK